MPNSNFRFEINILVRVDIENIFKIIKSFILLTNLFDSEKFISGNNPKYRKKLYE